MSAAIQPTEQRRSLLQAMAATYQMEPGAFLATIKATVMPSANATNEQVAAFLAVAHQYRLNPFCREVFAFPGKSGGIQAVVSVDGWSKLINEHEDFDGMEFEDKSDGGQIASITCRIHRKSRSHPVEVTEYMVECKRDTDTWKRWPRRMLRHKAMIQAARYAFGFAGIVDPDEAERALEVTVEPAGSAERVADLKARLRAVTSDADNTEPVPETTQPATAEPILFGDDSEWHDPEPQPEPPAKEKKLTRIDIEFFTAVDKIEKRLIAATSAVEARSIYQKTLTAYGADHRDGVPKPKRDEFLTALEAVCIDYESEGTASTAGR